jgi:hypothetical protein
MLESIVVTPHGRVVQLGEHLTGKQVVVLIKIYQNKGVIRACSSAGRASALQAREFILSIPFPASVSIVSNKLGNLLLVQS